jgi:heme/copper-type cytochrome/quinol oxidase subunit 2
MRGLLGATVALAVFFLGGNLAGQPQSLGNTTTGQVKSSARQENATGDQAEAKVFELTAKKYEYSPGEIHVKKGTRVQLKIRALDRTHGFKISPYPEGAAKNGQPGLRFAGQQDNWKIEKDQERVIEFVAQRAGTYAFKCSVFCGLGHGGMKGKLVVKE